MSGETWHGTEHGYVKHRCRCDACKSAGLESRRARRKRNPDGERLRWRRYYERLERGQVALPELDRAICERGGSEAQEKAHHRRGEKPCANCRRAANEAHQRRKSVAKAKAKAS